MKIGRGDFKHRLDQIAFYTGKNKSIPYQGVFVLSFIFHEDLINLM